MQNNGMRIAVGVSLAGLGLLANFAIDLKEIEYPLRTFYALGVATLFVSGVYCAGTVLLPMPKRYRWTKH